MLKISKHILIFYIFIHTIHSHERISISTNTLKYKYIFSKITWHNPPPFCSNPYWQTLSTAWKLLF